MRPTFYYMLILFFVVCTQSYSGENQTGRAHDLQVICRTNKSTYYVGEPIYLTVTVSVGNVSSPITGNWFIDGGGFNYALYPAGKSGRSLLKAGQESTGIRVAGRKSSLTRGKRITTTFEAIYAEDYRQLYAPGPNATIISNHLHRPDKFPLKWSSLFEYGQGEYEFEIYQDTTSKKESKAYKVRSNRFRVIKPTQTEPKEIFDFTALSYVSWEKEKQKAIGVLKNAEKRIKEGRVPLWLHAAYMHTIMRQYREIKQWKDAIRVGRILLETHAGYPLREDVEFDLAEAYFADGNKAEGERTLWYLLERIGSTERIQPIRRFPAKPDDKDLIVANRQYDRILSLIRKGIRKPVEFPSNVLGEGYLEEETEEPLPPLIQQTKK